jgi:phospholipid transport system transporter-binding protein
MTTLALTGELTINEAAAKRKTLLQWVADEPAGTDLDLSAIEACDSAGVQLLLALRRTLAERGHGLKLRAAPDCVAATLATYGLAADTFHETKA